MPARRRFSGNVARVFSFQWIKWGLVILSSAVAVAFANEHSASRHDFELACDGIEIGTNASVADARFDSPPARWLRIGNRHRWWLVHAFSSNQDVCDFEIDEKQNVLSVKYEIKRI